MSIAEVPTFKIDLDLAPELRYLEIFLHFEINIKKIYKSFLRAIPECRLKHFPALCESLKKTDYDYYMEMESLSKIIDMPISDWVAVDFVCEATTGCTSILARLVDDDGEARIVHGRNLDYPVAVETMRDSLYKGVFSKDGKELCVAVIFAGFQGIYTGIKSKAFSISYNLRNLPQKNGFLKTMVLAFLGYKKWSMIIRDTFINCDTFEEAVSYISDNPAISPCYLTICGIDKGAKLTCDRFKNRIDWVYAEDEEPLAKNDHEGENPNFETRKYYDIQTNFDAFGEIPEKDNGRYEMATELMNILNPAILRERRMLYNVLHVSPVCNKETVYCCFMDPSTYKCTIMLPDADK